MEVLDSLDEVVVAEDEKRVVVVFVIGDSSRFSLLDFFFRFPFILNLSRLLRSTARSYK